VTSRSIGRQGQQRDDFVEKLRNLEIAKFHQKHIACKSQVEIGTSPQELARQRRSLILTDPSRQNQVFGLYGEKVRCLGPKTEFFNTIR